MTNEKNTSKFISATAKTAKASTNAVTQEQRTHAVLSMFGADTRNGVDDRTRTAIKTIARFENDNLATTFKKRTGFDMPVVKVTHAKKATLSTGRMK